MLQSSSVSIETKTSWAVASAAIFIIGMSFDAAWITAVALKEIANEVVGSRSVPALASAPAWVGSSTGGIIMARIAEARPALGHDDDLEVAIGPARAGR